MQLERVFPECMSEFAAIMHFGAGVRIRVGLVCGGT